MNGMMDRLPRRGLNIGSNSRIPSSQITYTAHMQQKKRGRDDFNVTNMQSLRDKIYPETLGLLKAIIAIPELSDREK